MTDRERELENALRVLIAQAAYTAGVLLVVADVPLAKVPDTCGEQAKRLTQATAAAVKVRDQTE